MHAGDNELAPLRNPYQRMFVHNSEVRLPIVERPAVPGQRTPTEESLTVY